MSLEAPSDMSTNGRMEEPATMPVTLVQHRPAPLLTLRDGSLRRRCESAEATETS